MTLRRQLRHRRLRRGIADDLNRFVADALLRPPLLVISDGAAGLINAAESSLPRSLRQRCLMFWSLGDSGVR